MQLNLESLRNEVNVLGKEMKGLVQRAVPKKAPAEETGASENDYDQAIEESETVIQVRKERNLVTIHNGFL